MATSGAALQIQPGKGLGFLSLGASLHDVLTRLRIQSSTYPSISISYSSKDTLQLPVMVNLPRNGIRLRFDGPEQRLRLIEVVDFSLVALSYRNTKSSNLVKLSSTPSSAKGASGPSYRQIYDIFSVTFPGEYFKPKRGSTSGTYVLSYPGLAFTFLVQDSVWNTRSESDFVAVLSSPAASAACRLAIFNGASWKDARQEYLQRNPPHPRTLHATARAAADEVEMVKIRGKGKITILRRFSRLDIVLGKTSPQDLIAELGPPDAIYRKNDYRLAIHKRRNTSSAARPDHLQSSIYKPEEADAMSAITDGSASDDEPAAANGAQKDTECFYNYFRHGFDVYLSDQTNLSPPLAPLGPESIPDPRSAPGGLVATKLILHANVPGSYAFNKYRRCRWVIDASRLPSNNRPTLTSETRFSDIGNALRKVWASSYSNEEEQRALERPMVLNRGWTDSPGSSCELLGELDDSDVSFQPRRNGGTVGNTELFGFPGLLFEVLRNDTVSCLTIY